MTGDDRELLSRLASGSPAAAQAALAELYARHAPSVLRFLTRLCDDPNQAEDVLQDTFLAAARRPGACRSDDARAWLLGIAGNRARDLDRGARRRTRRERAIAADEGEAAPEPVGDPLDVRAHAALASLGRRDRVVLDLRYTQGLTHGQVAEVLGVSLRTAKAWAERALEHLRSKLEGEA